MVSFLELETGQEYDRPFLAELWGYKGYQAISRGVVTPSNSNLIILFVTKEKQQALEQYVDYLDGNVLHWEGEVKHSSDLRIVNAQEFGDEIHLFYRDIHHTPFVYHGRIQLQSHTLHADKPSQFMFSMGAKPALPDSLDDIQEHAREYAVLDVTERDSISKSRIGQGKFRERLINFWGGCAVTGLTNLAVLRASHIKPWRDSSNQERLDPMNGLLLHPTLDHLFDAGLITFDDAGRIQMSTRLTRQDRTALQLDETLRLRKLTDLLRLNLRYHRSEVFEP